MFDEWPKNVGRSSRMQQTHLLLLNSSHVKHFAILTANVDYK